MPRSGLVVGRLHDSGESPWQTSTIAPGEADQAGPNRPGAAGGSAPARGAVRHAGAIVLLTIQACLPTLPDPGEVDVVGKFDGCAERERFLASRPLVVSEMASTSPPPSDAICPSAPASAARTRGTSSPGLCGGRQRHDHHRTIHTVTVWIAADGRSALSGSSGCFAKPTAYRAGTVPAQVSSFCSQPVAPTAS